ncbi:hypothetical protein MMC24_003864 [Lignoscripta atroalba]|nr:hypothetical protein [Lignoscripta atroalba]
MTDVPATPKVKGGGGPSSRRKPRGKQDRPTSKEIKVKDEHRVKLEAKEEVVKVVKVEVDEEAVRDDITSASTLEAGPATVSQSGRTGKSGITGSEDCTERRDADMTAGGFVGQLLSVARGSDLIDTAAIGKKAGRANQDVYGAGGSAKDDDKVAIKEQSGLEATLEIQSQRNATEKRMTRQRHPEGKYQPVRLGTPALAAQEQLGYTVYSDSISPTQEHSEEEEWRKIMYKMSRDEPAVRKAIQRVLCNLRKTSAWQNATTGEQINMNKEEIERTRGRAALKRKHESIEEDEVDERNMASGDSSMRFRRDRYFNSIMPRSSSPGPRRLTSPIPSRRQMAKKVTGTLRDFSVPYGLMRSSFCRKSLSFAGSDGQS